jgi:hypothetical protein
MSHLLLADASEPSFNVYFRGVTGILVEVLSE